MISQHHKDDLADVATVMNQALGVVSAINDDIIDADYINWEWLKSRIEDAESQLLRVREAVDNAEG